MLFAKYVNNNISNAKLHFLHSSLSDCSAVTCAKEKFQSWISHFRSHFKRTYKNAILTFF